MKYTKKFLKGKTKDQLINIVLRLQNKNHSNLFDVTRQFVIADGTTEMREGE